MLKNKRILVTGGGGFIGSHLARELFNAGNFVRVADMNWSGYLQEPYYSDKQSLDLRILSNCLKATDGIEYVFNLAANMGGIGFITEVGADIMYDNTLINTNMPKACMDNHVKRVLFSSSACVYPTYKQEDVNLKPLSESDAFPADPDSFYGWEKLYSEKMYESFKKDYKLDIRIARYHNIYGPEGTYNGGREKSPAAICRKVIEATNPGHIEIWGDGLQTRSYCYINDCVDATIRLMESDYSLPINIGTDRLISINELADMVITYSKKQITKTYKLDAPQGVRGRNADLTLVKKVLGWQPTTPLEQGIARTYDWIEAMVSSDKRRG